MDDIVEFKQFEVKLLKRIPNYTDDRNFNKITIWNNTMFVTNGSEVFKADVSEENSVIDIQLDFIERINT